MRISPNLILVALCAASTAAAAQQAVQSIAKAPAGISIAYDASRGQLTASGYQLKPAAKTNSTPLSGTLEVTLDIKLISPYAAGSTFPCSVIAINGLIDTDTITVDGAVEYVTGVATVAKGGATAACIFTIPYELALSSDPGAGASSGLVLAYAIASANSRGVTERYLLSLGGLESLPANGATSKYTFNAVL